MKVLLTRPARDSARMAEPLTAAGAECLIWPLTEIVPLTERVEIPEGTEALIFTSPNGVRAFAAASPNRELAVLTVGDGTAAKARQAGFHDVTSAEGDAGDLIRLIQGTSWRRLLHLRGRDIARDLAGALADDAREVAEAIIYAAEPAGPPSAEVARAFRRGELDLVTVWSPRHAAILGEWLAAERPDLHRVELLGISENAVAPLRAAGFRRIATASDPDAAAMLRWIYDALPA